MIPPSGPRGRIALALGGGAALGFAHIGVLRALAAAGIEVGAVAGTSMGALVAAAHAFGRLDRLEAMARAMTRAGMIGYLMPGFGRGGWLSGNRAARELLAEFGTSTLDRASCPLALVATDFDTGDEVRLTTGPAVPALRASMALPPLFAPVTIAGRTLIDGGMAATVPLAAARALAPDLPLVAVDVLGDMAGHVTLRGPAPSALAVQGSAFVIMALAQTRMALAACPPAALIRPAVGHIGAGAFTRAAPLIEAGRAAAEAALPSIRRAIDA